MSDQQPKDPYRGDGMQGPPGGWQPPQGPAGGGYPAGPPPGGWQPPAHPSATTVLVLGILGLVVCGVLAPFAWLKGSAALREIDAAPRRWSGRDQVQIGRVLGIIGSVLLGLAVLVLGGMLLLFLISATATFTVS